MPRKSAAELQIVPISKAYKRIEAPPGLSGIERQLFESIVEQCAPMHFTQSDAPMLASYVETIVLREMAYQAALESPSALGDWERCCRMMAALSVKLRIDPHSRLIPRR